MIADQTQTPEASKKNYKYIDCDVHHILPNFGTLMEYLEPGLRRRIELATNARSEARNAFQMPRRAYFNPTSTARVDTMDADGTNHASIPQRIKEDLLDRYEIKSTYTSICHGRTNSHRLIYLLSFLIIGYDIDV